MQNVFFDTYFAQDYRLEESPIALSFREQGLLSLAELSLYGEKYLLLLVKSKLSFSELSQLYQRFSQAGPLPPVFLLPKGNAYAKKLLINAKIPFFSSEGLIYLPGKLLYGRFPSATKEESLPFSPFYIPIIQFFLTYPLAKINSRELLGEIHSASRSLVIKGLAFLCQEGFLIKEGSARNTVYLLKQPLEVSYLSAQKWLINPLKESFYVKKEEAAILDHSVYSSESALSSLSDLAEEEESFLLTSSDYENHRDIFIRGENRLSGEAYERFDVFLYPPWLRVDKKGHKMINPLDLIALYRQDADPRVQGAIKKLEQHYR